MEHATIRLAFLWLAVMLVYLLGDVLRIYAGDFQPGKIEGKTMPAYIWLGIVVLMFIPIGMMLLNIFVANTKLLLVNILSAGVLFLFNAVGLPSYKAPYDAFLIIVGLLLNLITIWISLAK